MRRRLLLGMRVLFVCIVAATMACHDKPDARLVEAQADFDAATTLKGSGHYSEAFVRAGHALALREATLGNTHPDVATCLDLMGDLSRRQGELDRAEDFLQRALVLREAALGPNHPDTASSLNSLAAVYGAQGLYGQAEPLSQRSLAIRESALGLKHPDVANSLNNLAVLYIEQGLFDRAEPLFQRSLAIRESALGPNHPDVTNSLSNLAVLYMEHGLFDRAEPLFQRSLAIREAVLGPNHPVVASSLGNLAVLYKHQGLFDRAEPLFQRSLAIREAVLGKQHPDVANSLTNLASVYVHQGLFSRAEPLLQRSLAIRETALGPNHPGVANSLTSIAVLYVHQGLFGRAEPLFQRSLAIREAALGPSHPDVANSLGNLANIYLEQGMFGQAEPLLQRSLALRETALGPSHPGVANSLTSLAVLYSDQGLFDQAEPLFQRSLALQEAAFVSSHPDVINTIDNFAQLRLAQRRLADALPLFTRSLSLSERRLRREALDFSESRLSEFLQHLSEQEEMLYALLRTHPGDARVRRLALSAVLLLKGRSVEETANISRTVYRGLGAKDRDTFERLGGLRSQLATLALAGPGTLASGDHRQRLEDLAEEGDALEADLAKRSAPLRSLTALPRLDDIVERVAASLPKDSALVEFVAYTDSPLIVRPGTSHAKRVRQSRYLALVLFPDASTRAVDLGPAASLDAAASRLRDALVHREASIESPAQALYRLAFKPLLPLLGTTRRLLLSPDGQLGLMPFAALHDGRGFLVDDFDFTYLTSGRELLPQPRRSASSVFVLADPQFSAAPSSSSSTTALERFFSRADLPRGAWAPLPGTRQEAENIQRLLPQARLFLGAEATKERLLGLSTPGILHLATHGFFLGDVPVSSSSTRAVDTLALPDGPPPPQSEPLLNSGLVLAGASTSQPEATLVTALELAGLDLWGTQLVVLSACDTGRGEIRVGQGVLGLRRALVVAGAETVVSSLWKVNDDSTQVLMAAYYRSLLEGRGRASALREAMLFVRRTHPHPYHWAPFIALGSDAPLRGITPGEP